MQDIQAIFHRIEENKKKLKELKDAYKDALKTSGEHVELSEKMKTLRERKKAVERTIQEQFSSEFTKMEDLSIDIASDQEMLNDIALTQMMSGASVAVKDAYDNEYEPVFNVKFKKIA